MGHFKPLAKLREVLTRGGFNVVIFGWVKDVPPFKNNSKEHTVNS